MAKQKIGKMKKHEMGESREFERKEKMADKKHFIHEGIENVSDHRKCYYTNGNAVGCRESAGK